jgi:polyisoprenoid-binding protein YceI
MCERAGAMARPRVPLMLICLGLSVSGADGATFAVDPGRTSLVVQVFRDGVAARFGHDHVVRATAFSGRVNYDTAAPDGSSIRVDVDTTRLEVDDRATRRKFGLIGEPSAADVADIERSMKAATQLDVSTFPRMTFVSTRMTADAQDRYVVSGQLTIRAVSNAVRFPARVWMEGNLFRASATLEFLQSSFGYAPYRALLGAIRNRDDVKLHVDLTATPE